MLFCNFASVHLIHIHNQDMASYWTRKDDQSGETATIYPWQEKIGGGDKEFPEPPEQESDSSDDVSSKG